MGILISRFRRKKSTGETLAALDSEVRSMEQYGRSTEQQRRRILGSLVVGLVGLYVLVLFAFYFYFRPRDWREALLYCTPLLISPFLIIVLRNVLGRYYDWKLRRNRARLLSLRAKKKSILEEVMDKETYKVAKDILEKYGNTESEKPPAQVMQLVRSPVPPGGPRGPAPGSVGSPMQLRQRQSLGAPVSPLPRLMPPPSQATPNQLVPLGAEQLPRPIVSGGGGAFERLVDYLIGDGPGSRYALICTTCNGHNGMALPEEFEYVAFRCAYCRHPNAARKTRPRPPMLVSTPIHTDTSDHKSSTEESDTDEEDDPVGPSLTHCAESEDSGSTQVSNSNFRPSEEPETQAREHSPPSDEAKEGGDSDERDRAEPMAVDDECYEASHHPEEPSKGDEEKKQD